MDWKIFFATFSAIFVAELADKTQLVGISMAAKSGKPLTVLLGSVAGYILVTAISVLIGAVLSKYIRPDVIKYGGASLFVIIGILMFMGKV
ncbi:MAG: TMEM165/GDT1 family protein [Candidatus Omnitrophota bacterium]|jgi:putative Ca2+/H+ antiporter (TMEM165/GDT1 family)|nr:TMEM165/GDT1 family protein [Candidatus Omnitrophota bacterium]